MNKNLKYVLIAVFLIIAIVVVFSYFSPANQEKKQKQQEIDSTFNIWTDIAGTSDKQTLIQNEAAIKKDLFDKLTVPEVVSLKQYSTSIKDLISVKNTPFNPLFISSLSYLTSNFNSAKEIIGKTGIGAMISNLVLGPIPQSNYNPITV